MGLTFTSTGKGAFADIKNINKDCAVIALAGNPNVGKSTVFNELTGLNQHTGNWAGKTVTNAHGITRYKEKNYIMVDIPGTYSLLAHSAEEEVARDFICFGGADAVIVVCDATCIERNMNLVLQTMEITDKVLLCVNLMDEAENKKIRLDLKAISQKLKIPVVGTNARRGKGLTRMMEELRLLLDAEDKTPMQVNYAPAIEEALSPVTHILAEKLPFLHIKHRWIALKLLQSDTDILEKISLYADFDILSDTDVKSALEKAFDILDSNQITAQELCDYIVSSIVLCAEDVCRDAVHFDNPEYNARDRKADRIFTSKITGIPIMIALLGVIFFITLVGANAISDLISAPLFLLQDKMLGLCIKFQIPPIIYKPLILGVYRVVAWVTSVMLPPMAIFFPLFTLLEDLGYLPRVAFNLDKAFKKCCACGKQALTMCMGFGCNAAGVVGCRIIDSKRERLIALLTNNFVPCNGRFPILVAIISMFFTFSLSGAFRSLAGAALLTAFVLLGILLTFLVSFLLSKTILRGEPSSFTLELPPYRKPQIGKILVRSVFDRTLFVLGRAVTAAAPAGLIIWLMANITAGDATLLSHAAGFLNPFAKIIGLDGTILLAFILGLPANEIVMPIIIMAYMSSGTLSEFESLTQLKALLVDNGWTFVTAINTMLFSLVHWPCSTTLMTIKKETGSIKWTFLAFALPTVTGLILCFVFTSISKLFL